MEAPTAAPPQVGIATSVPTGATVEETETTSESPTVTAPPAPTEASTSVVVEPATGTTASPALSPISTSALTETVPPTLAPSAEPTPLMSWMPTLPPTTAPPTVTITSDIDQAEFLGGIPENYAANQQPNLGGKNIIFIADDTVRGRYPDRRSADISHPPTVSQLPSKQGARVIAGFPTFDGLKAMMDDVWKGRETVEAPKVRGPAATFTELYLSVSTEDAQDIFRRAVLRHSSR